MSEVILHNKMNNPTQFMNTFCSHFVSLFCLDKQPKPCFGSCVAAGFSDGCCLIGCSSNESCCYCDLMCYESGNCCDDIEDIGCYNVLPTSTIEFDVTSSFLVTINPSSSKFIIHV